MRAYEFINEVFDKPWELETNTKVTNQIKNIILSNNDGKGGLEVYQKKDDPSNIIFKIFYNNYWEVHHIYDNGVEYVSGNRLKPKALGGIGSNINTKFIATSIKLYKELLDNNQSIRITAPDNEHNLWSSYSKFINHWLKKNPDYMASTVVKDISIQGNPQISQTIRKYGNKWIEEMFNKPDVINELRNVNYKVLKESIKEYLLSKHDNYNDVESFINIMEKYEYIKPYMKWVSYNCFDKYLSNDINFDSINESLYQFEWLRFKNNKSIDNMSLNEVVDYNKRLLENVIIFKGMI